MALRKREILWITTLAVSITMPSATNADEKGKYCRSRSGWFTPEQFQYLSCADCYRFIVFDSSSYGIDVRTSRLLAKWSVGAVDDLHNLTVRLTRLQTKAASANRTTTTTDNWTVEAILPDVQKPETVAGICAGLGTDVCQRWTSCCRNAIACCQRIGRKRTLVADDGTGTEWCPAVWDGFSCIQETPAGGRARQECPKYVSSVVLHGAKFYKSCNASGVWTRSAKTNVEYTDYKTCISFTFEVQRINSYVKIGCSIVTIVALIPSIIIFLTYRSLRNQIRVQLHIHLFISLLISSLLWLTFDSLKYHYHFHEQSVENFNNAKNWQDSIWCRILLIAINYSTGSTFMWMFCEAYYLHKLLAKAFEPPKSVRPFIAIGWGMFLLPLTIYCVSRAILTAEEGDGCWLENRFNLNWILWGPSMATLLVNIFLLVNIMRILLTQLHSHPNEPSGYRKMLKAIVILVPLFGIQQALVIKGPAMNAQGYKEHLWITSFVTNTQGLFVALIFCLGSEEVRRSMGQSLQRLKDRKAFRKETTRKDSQNSRWRDSVQLIGTDRTGTNVTPFLMRKNGPSDGEPYHLNTADNHDETTIL